MLLGRRTAYNLPGDVYSLDSSIFCCLSRLFLLFRLVVSIYVFPFLLSPLAIQGTEIIKTNLKLNVFGVKLNSFFYHSYFPSASSMTWTLDYTKKSTLGIALYRVLSRACFGVLPCVVDCSPGCLS